MSYTVTIHESKPGDGIDTPAEKEIFRQTVEVLDLLALINQINKKPRKPRDRKPAKVQP